MEGLGARPPPRPGRPPVALQVPSPPPHPTSPTPAQLDGAIDGAIEPIIFAGRDGVTGRSIPQADRIESLAKRALKWSGLQKKKNIDKKVCVTVFSFPPDKGNVGTAAYLNVFGSIFECLKTMKAEGYDLGKELPASVEELVDEVLKDKEAKIASPELNVQYKMSIDEYKELTPYASELEENWGPPPGNLNSDGRNLLVYGKQFGNVFIGVQPSFGYEGDPMRLLYAKSASPHHGFAAYYTYVERIFGADAVLHFGTHGSLEFMPGKQVGMSGGCYPDRLIDVLPNLYYYAANNPSEATIAKRRSYASTISYLTPPAENAGLYKQLKELSDLVVSYQSSRESGKGATIVNSIVATAYQCNIDKDVDLPAEDDDSSTMTLEERDTVVGKVYAKIMEIESRLLPCGLHTVGVPPTAEEAIATLVNIASLDRNEDGIKSLPRILAESRPRHRGGLPQERTRATSPTCSSPRRSRRACAPPSGHRSTARPTPTAASTEVNEVMEASAPSSAGGSPMKKALPTLGFDVSDDEARSRSSSTASSASSRSSPTTRWARSSRASTATSSSPRRAATRSATRRCCRPARTCTRSTRRRSRRSRRATAPRSSSTASSTARPSTTTARTPSRSPSCSGAPTTSRRTASRSRRCCGWSASARCPTRSAASTRSRPIPLEELGRPRIDVVVTCSGVFRDLFINQMNLLDRAVKLVAELDEPLDQNFVRKHALEQAEELGVGVRDAATRVFSNAAGSYSANVGLAIENGGWEGEQQLQDQFLSRKGFAFNADKPGILDDQADLFKSSLKKVDVTFQNLDSSEISLSDVSHYFDSDPTKVVPGLRTDGKKPTAFVADTTTANAQVRTLSETVRLDARTKLLNPKFYEGMLKSGYEGTREITKRLRNTMGWSATAGAVDNFVYEDANETFIADEEMQKRLMETNPNAFRDMVTTFLEANGRGYWETSEDNLDRLRQLYSEVDDKIEGM